MKKLKMTLLLFVLLVSFPVVLFAHPGRTDSNGGHYDRSTGEYHYHHGYPAHQHPNGICPYTDQASTSTVTNTTSSKEKSSSKKDTTTKNTSKNESKNTSNKKSNTTKENNEKGDNSNVGDVLLLGGIATVIGIGTIPNITSKFTSRNKNNSSSNISSTNTENQTAEKENSNSKNNLQTKISKQPSKTSNYSYRCPRCGGALRIRSGRYGQFLGCSNYPNCRYTRSINRKKRY